MKTKIMAAGIIIIGLFSEAINLLYIVYVSEIINRYKGDDLIGWQRVVIDCVIFLVALFLFQFLKEILIARFKRDITLMKKKEVFNCLKRKRKDKLIELTESKVVLAIQNTNAYGELMMHYLSLIISGTILIVACIFVTTYISYLYLLGMIALIVILFVSMILSSPVEKKRNIVIENQKNNIALFKNMTQSISIIKNYYMEKPLKSRFFKSVQSFKKNKIAEKDYELILYIYNQVVRCGIMIMIPTFTAYLVMKGAAKESDVIVATYGFFFILNHFMYCMGAFAEIGKKKSETKYAEEIFQTDDERSEMTTMPKKEILYQGVCCSYGDNKILTNKSTQLFTNKINTITGESGIGKSTFLKCITGNKQFDSGELLLDQKQSSTNTLNSLMCYAPQNAVVFEMSPYDNILLGNSQTTVSDIKKVLREISPTLIEAFDSCENAKKLSGGQKQIISILRCLFSDRKIIVLDEPTASLNSTLVQGLMKVFKQMKYEKTFVIVSHDNLLLEESDYIVYF